VYFWATFPPTLILSAYAAWKMDELEESQ